MQECLYAQWDGIWLGGGVVCSEMCEQPAKSSAESQKANFFCDGGWPVSERDVWTAAEGARLYDGCVIQLLCRDSDWCDTVHNAALALLLTDKLS